MLESRDRALLAEHRAVADADDSLVRADLAAVADPRPAAQFDYRLAANLKGHIRADEEEAVAA